MKALKWLVGVAGLGVVVFWLVLSSRADPVEVSVETVSKGLVEASVANTRAGTIKACQRAQMSPSIGGQISELPFAEGQMVKKGDVLLRLWNVDLASQVLLAESSLQAARDHAQASCVQADVAQRTANRFERLRASAHVSTEKYDQASAEARIRRAECKASRANELVAGAQIKVAEAQVDRTLLLAPFDGVVANINGELNEYVTPSPVGVATPPVVDLIAPDCFLATAPIDEVDAPRVEAGLLARITLDAYRGRVFEGVVTRVGSYVIDQEKQARTVDIELAFASPDDFGALLVGYSADVDIVTETKDQVLRIPAQALSDENEVLVYDESAGTISARSIERGLSNWSWVEVVSGLQIGDRVVTSLGTEGVEDGAAVVLVNGVDK